MITYNIILLYFFSKSKEFIKNKKSIYLLFIYYILVKFFNDISNALTEWVNSPEEIKSTPDNA